MALSYDLETIDPRTESLSGYTSQQDTAYINYINPINRLSATNENRVYDLKAEMQQILNSPSMVHFGASWDTDEESDDSWDDSETDSDSSSADNGLQMYHYPEQKTENAIYSNEDIQIKHTINKYWNIGKHKGYKYPFCVYADKYFNKIGQSAAHLFKYQPYKERKHALIKMNLHLDKEAKQMWKNINSFMGTRQSTKDTYGHAHKILAFALNDCQDIRDEIYCQILKQITGCPSMGVSVNGWKLLCICCSTFAPSQELALYLASFLFSHTKQSGVIGAYASFALKALDETIVCGSRHLIPTQLEIQRIQQLQPMEIKLYFCSNDIFKNILVYSQTTIQQMLSSVMRALDITHLESFAIFEVMKDNDITASKWPYIRELDLNERVLDAWSEWNPQYTNDKLPNENMCFQLQYKKMNIMQLDTYSLNEWTLVYLTNVWNVKHGRYRLKEDEICHLAAMQLQYEYGMKEDVFFTSNIVEDIIHRFIPYHLFKTHTSKQWLSKIRDKHGLYQHLNANDIHKEYTKYLRNVCQYFGAQWFECKVKINDEIKEVRVGITEACIVVMNCNTFDIMKRYKMENITGYSYTEHIFTIAVDTIGTPQKYDFKTISGRQMVHLLREYIYITPRTTKGVNLKETQNQTPVMEQEDNDNETVAIHSYPTPTIAPIAIKRHPTDSSEGQPRNGGNNGNIAPNMIVDDTAKEDVYDVPYDIVELLTNSDVIPQYKEEKQQQFMWDNSALCESSEEEEYEDVEDEDEGWIDPKIDNKMLTEIMAMIDHEHEANSSDLIGAMTQYTKTNNEGNKYAANGRNNEQSNESNDDNTSNGNHHNYNHNNYNGDSGANGGRRDKNGNNGDKHRHDLKENDEDEEDEDEEEEEKEDKHELNKNAKEFIPHFAHRMAKKPQLKTIHEKQYKQHRVIQSSYDPMPEYRARFQVHIAREFTAKIIIQIQETFNNIYAFMDKSLSLQMGQNMFNDNYLWIVNYGFHDKITNEVLYCAIVPTQDKKSRNWKMLQQLYTAQEIQNMYHIQCTSLPKSIRSLSFNADILNKRCMLRNKLMNAKQVQTIIHCTPWHKISVLNRNNNKKRMILKLNKPEFMKRLRRFVSLTESKEDIKFIPILMFDTKLNMKYCAYHMEYLWIVRIAKDTDIGISFIFNTDSDTLMVSGIHLDKTFMLNQHQLAVPQCHSCQCLDSFISNITHLKIGNPDDDLNRIKDLTKKYKIVTQQLTDKQHELKQKDKELREMQLENERLKHTIEVLNNHSQQSIHSSASASDSNINSIALSSIPLSPSYSANILPSCSTLIPSIPNLAQLNINHVPGAVNIPITQPLLYPYQLPNINGNAVWIANQH